MPLRPFRSRSFRALRTGLHRLLGWCYYQLGAHEHARDRFERVLEIRGDDFMAYVYLGRLAYSDGDYAGWRRECELALRTSPERFAKLRHPFDLHVPRAASGATKSFEDAGERASWRSFQVGIGSPTEPSMTEPSMTSGDLLDGLTSKGYGDSDSTDLDGDALDLDPLKLEELDFEALRRRQISGGRRRRGGDDFISARERAHFDGRDPLSQDEIRAVDFDALSQQLGSSDD